MEAFLFPNHIKMSVSSQAQIPLKTCSTSSTRRVTLVTNLVIIHERGNDRIVINSDEANVFSVQHMMCVYFNVFSVQHMMCVYFKQ
jgi:hypothetical protein